MALRGSPGSVDERPSAAPAVFRARQGLPEQSGLHWRNLLFLSILLALLIAILHLFFRTGFAGENYLLLALTTSLWVAGGWELHRGALKALRQARVSVDTLLALGPTVVYGMSLVATFLPHLLTPTILYATTALLMIPIFLGKYLEARVEGQTREAVQTLIRSYARPAHVIREGVERESPIEQIQVGDELIVRPGERIPVEGVITEGASLVEEPGPGGKLPVEKGAGDTVIGASMNHQGLLKIRVSGAGTDLVSRDTARLMEAAERSRTSRQQLSEAITRSFAASVLVMAGVTLLGWLLVGNSAAFPASLPGVAPPWIVASTSAVALLIIACSNVPGLATPMVMMAALGQGAQLGIVIRGGEGLEQMLAAQVVLLDTVGTITKSKPVLTDVIALPGFDEQELLRLVASAEQGSEHPLASAIIEGAQGRGLVLDKRPEAYTALIGRGLEARVGGHDVLVGTRRLLRERAIDFAPLEATMERFEVAGKTVVLAAIDGLAAGLVATSNSLKIGSAEAISQLRKQGLDLWMITGDNPRAAQITATQAAIPSDHIFAEVLAQDKAGLVKQFQKQGLSVAFVGDGINDVPALTQANIGFAVGTGTDITIEAADVTLVKDNLKSAATLLDLSRATMRTIKQNLLWNIAYKSILIPFAILSPLFPFLRENAPLFAAGAIVFFSVTIMSNSLRLLRFGRKAR